MPNFIAVQCFQCSTMQVKQQKKSSNKWNCAVCNEKQSVRKLFAQGFVAKDVRHFVQNFNMSRQSSDQKQFLAQELETFNSPTEEVEMMKKKRTDWTEYLDNDRDERCRRFEDEQLPEGDNGCNPTVITEMPKSLLKKQKLRDNCSHACGVRKLLKPTFPDRTNARKRHGKDGSKATDEFEETSCERASKTRGHTRVQDICSDEEAITLHLSDRSSKWSCFRAQMQDQNSNTEDAFVKQPTKGVTRSIYVERDDKGYANGAPRVSLDQTRASKAKVSKWSSFITEEDEDDLEIRGRIDSWDSVNQRRNDEKVEDPIHPDFL